MGSMVDSLLWVIQDFYHQQYDSDKGSVQGSGFRGLGFRV